MCIRNYKIIYLLLVVFVLISGMCFEKIRTDSSLLHASMDKASSYLVPCRAQFSNDKVCTTEMLGNCGVFELQMLSQYISQKREMRVSLDLLYLNIFSLPDGKLVSSEETTQFFHQNLNRLVTHYIHQSDGKKRIGFPE
ncbi:MAG: hypothetical protein J6C19_09175 [Lachnospiraceae bacterium]|nr:hypothetical protein [Lachnospiraceae bacterium]MBO5145688.1 hypothetical protein [Lachnospiraceae bacterium]